MAITTKQPRLYFAYGSNLSLSQMASRCPTSTYHSFGVLRGYKWIIGERGYANVIKTKPKPKPSSSFASKEIIPGKEPNDEKKFGDESTAGEERADEVYGMLYVLEEEDEEKLDIAEGVPYAYVKRELDVELVSKVSGGGRGEVVQALVYVDEQRLGEGVCQEEYVARMNRGIGDAVGKGMERGYVEGVLRRFIREEEVDGVVVDPFHPEKMSDEGMRMVRGSRDGHGGSRGIGRGGRNRYQEA